MSLIEGKNCLITGATSGIGRSTSLALSKLGANIFFIARNPNKAKKLSQEIRSFAADNHNAEIQKGLETALNKLKKGPTQERLDVAFFRI